MPELPEVETTVQGIKPFLLGQNIQKITVRNGRLRWPVPADLVTRMKNQNVQFVSRRGKYILIGVDQGGILIHLGMSGSLRVLQQSEDPGKHDHFDVITDGGSVIRYHDPRRFGCLLWHPDDIYEHPLLSRLGVEPLQRGFDGSFLYKIAKTKKVPIKTMIMNADIVVGVGNIYASESLFDAGINPKKLCCRISKKRMDRLADSIKKILGNAIAQGGTTLRDFLNTDGKPGYFEQNLTVYGREGENCTRCAGKITKVTQAQRSTFYCARCQR